MKQHNRKPNHINDSRFDWRTIFLKNSGGISSKRLISLIGFLTCVGVFIAAFILEKPIPDFGETLLISSLSLYGVEAIPNFWTKSINKS